MCWAELAVDHFQPAPFVRAAVVEQHQHLNTAKWESASNIGHSTRTHLTPTHLLVKASSLGSARARRSGRAIAKNKKKIKKIEFPRAPHKTRVPSRIPRLAPWRLHFFFSVFPNVFLFPTNTVQRMDERLYLETSTSSIAYDKAWLFVWEQCQTPQDTS